MGYEVGKNRLECVGDVEEGADLVAYYCDQIEQHNGFIEKMGTLGPGEDNVSVLRPVRRVGGYLALNFPLALAAGPAGGALVWKYGRLQACERYALDGSDVHRDGG